MDYLIKSVEELANPTCLIDAEKLKQCGLTGIVLREYQLQGINWLANCDSQKHGGLLCDEMGLGKTCQVICFILATRNEKPDATFLIVCPLSVIENWKCELENIAPGILFMTYIGDKLKRQDLRSNYNKSVKVILTTYELCINDEAFFSNIYWNYVIIDEGHRLKNCNTQLYAMLTSTCLGTRFILTGTPVQNNLGELFNLLHFVAPKYFRQQLYSTFVGYFTRTDESSEKSKIDEDMAKVLRPFLLRRIKQNVLTDLPPRVDVLIYHSLTCLQTQIYRTLLTRNLELFVDTFVPQNDVRVCNRLNNLIMQLRKCVNHPYLFDGVEPEPFTLGEHLVNASAKLTLLDFLLAFLYNPHKSNNNNSTENSTILPSDSKAVHKVLIFSQFTRMLDIIQDYLTLRGYSYERLDGSVRGEDRFHAINSFNKDRETFVFLLSTRAGGQGLNLVAADTIVFVDNDFNPQIDVQAAGRAHRIGQTKPVRVIRLVGRHTIEEAILARAETKLKLAARVLNASDANCGGNQDDKRFTFDELNNVLKFGLAKLLKSTEEDNDEVGNSQQVKHEDADANNNNNNSVKIKSQDGGGDIQSKHQPNFTIILGETDPDTGHWLPLPSSASDMCENEDLNSSCDWVLLTDEPFHCETTKADEEAVERLLKDYESSKSKPKIDSDIRGVRNDNYDDDDDNDVDGDDDTELYMQEYNEKLKNPSSRFPQMSSRSKVLTPEEIETRRKKVAEMLAERQQKRMENKIKQRKARLEKKASMWQSVGYRTFSVFREESLEAESRHYPNPTGEEADDDEDIDGNTINECNELEYDDDHDENDAQSLNHRKPHADIYYKIGDVTKPLSIFAKNQSRNDDYNVDGNPPYFVCVSVDDSGKWGHGGIFRVLDTQCNGQIKNAYELAGQMDDLNLGDCLIIPVLDPDNLSLREKKISTFDDCLNHHLNETTASSSSSSTSNDLHWSTNFCGLLVVQKHIRRNRSDFGVRSDLDLRALERCLSALGMTCARLKAGSVHIPRLGHGSQVFTWYAIERLLKKHLVDHYGISVYVYYYPRNSRRSDSTQLNIQPTTPDSTAVSPPLRNASSKKGLKRNPKPQDNEVSDNINSNDGKTPDVIRPAKHLRNLFTGKSFYLHNSSKGGDDDDDCTEEMKKLKRIIITYPFL
uniref:Helicase ATP-binding domain-containing protein n=1 Tax=Trichobilharzia regenti TaxID=157069 RepID=A0AA85J0L6_TRIRE|nr:unnamed protein product [Trichobilharzia regenti]